MKTRRRPAGRGPAAGVPKASTGIAGFDSISRGGLPHGRTTLLTGGPGSGKTIFSLQFLLHGVESCNEPGIFVAFEESPARIIENLAGFDWSLEKFIPKRLYFMDAQTSPDLLQSGDFDVSGLLASLGSVAKKMRARRIVFDALDVMLALLPDAGTRRREVYRIHEWLLEHKMTGIITAKAGGDEASMLGLHPSGFMQFMVDCALVLNHNVVLGVSQRSLRVQKYRGSAFDENDAPFVISKSGFDVAISRTLGVPDIRVSTERVSSGVKRLDTMLGGGYYRASSVLITGFPGTAKTTLSGAFTEAACLRGERTVFVSFDSDGSELARNLRSVGIQLNRFVKSGLLRVISARTIVSSAETLLVRIKALAKEHGARCLVIDPMSTLAKAGNELTANNVAERLLDWCKTEDVTLVTTSLLDESSSQQSGDTPLHISTLADTWIHLNYVVQSGERNRGLSIIKARGTAHSNQVRELILSASGVTLADIYTSGGEVLMGTLRWERENALRNEGVLAAAEHELKHRRLKSDEAEIRFRMHSLRTEQQVKQAEAKLLAHTAGQRRSQTSRGLVHLQKLRGGDLITRSRL